MKTLRITAIILAIMSLLTLGASAIEFVESIERKGGPEVVSGGTDADALIITPVKEIFSVPVVIHKDIEDNLKAAHKELGSNPWSRIIGDFAAQWEAFTGGAPEANAIISDIFDVRYTSELGAGNGIGKQVEFKVRIEGITHGDLFMIIAKDNTTGKWQILNYTIDEKNIITLNATTMTAYAVVRDNGAAPVIDPNAPSSPQTGVDGYGIHTLIAAAVLGGAAVCLGVIAKKRKG